MTAVGSSKQVVVETRRRLTTASAWALFVLAVVGLALSAWSEVTFFDRWGDAYGLPSSWLRERVAYHGFMVLLLAYPLVGAVVASRRPRHPIGWLLLVGGLMVVVDSLAGSYSQLALAGAPADPSVVGLLAAGMRNWTWTVFSVCALLLVPLLFPDGRLPSARWRVIPWTAAALLALEFTGRALPDRFVRTVNVDQASAPVTIYDVANPVGVAGGLVDGPGGQVIEVVGAGGFFVLGAAVVLSVVARFGRSSGVRRQQLKWFVFAVLLWVAAVLVIFVVEVLLDLDPPDAVNVIWMIPVALIPASIGLAVLRYRLYEIDRVISRTVTYGLVIVAMGAVYVAGVVGLGAAVAGMTGEEGGDLVVAASVLAVVALFRPVRSRVQAVVDRRFNRTGYQARRAVDAFVEGLRDEVDLGAIERDLGATAGEALQPTRVSVWLADREEAR